MEARGTWPDRFQGRSEPLCRSQEFLDHGGSRIQPHGARDMPRGCLRVLLSLWWPTRLWQCSGWSSHLPHAVMPRGRRKRSGVYRLVRLPFLPPDKTTSSNNILHRFPLVTGSRDYRIPPTTPQRRVARRTSRWRLTASGVGMTCGCCDSATILRSGQRPAQLDTRASCCPARKIRYRNGGACA